MYQISGWKERTRNAIMKKQKSIRGMQMEEPIFNIAVCDDELPDRDTIADMTKEVCDLDQINAQISCFGNAEELLKTMQEGKQYHMLLLDVMMPGQDGMELARYLREDKRKIPIVFISSNREMALRGYEVAAARYLAKPVDKERLREAVAFCYEQGSDNEEMLVPFNGGVRKVAPKEIYYIEIKGRKSRITQEKEEWDTPLTMEKLEMMLTGHKFIRCHQSFLVNCRYVRILCTSHLELMDGRCIPVSKHRIKKVRETFFQYMEH